MPTTVFHDSSLSFVPPLLNISQPQCLTQPFNTVSAGNSSSPGCSSSSSASSTSSSFHESSNSPMRSPDTTTIEDVSVGDKPYLQIIEEPCDKFRFRYITEMQGTHGAILGINSQHRRCKTFPKVKLCNYKPNKQGKNPIIRCTVSTVEEQDHKRTAHVHRLVSKITGEPLDDPHDVEVRGPHYTATFEHMTILFTKKDEQVDFLVNKKQSYIRRRFTDANGSHFKMLSSQQLKTAASEDLKNMNLNVVCLRFEAIIDGGEGLYNRLCPPVYSQPINNMKNPQTNELKICRVDKCMGSCEGRQEVFMFVEKVVKKNIKVKFYEEDGNKDIVWFDYAEFSPEDVHHQFGIVFRTPPYRDPNIKSNVLVYFQLERPSDNAVSAPLKYEYTPNPDHVRDLARKRPRQDSYPTTVLDFEKRQTTNPFQSAIAVDPVLRVPPTQEPVPSDLRNVTVGEALLGDELLQMLLNDLIPVASLPQQPMEEVAASVTSSNISFNEVFQAYPSADLDAISQFLNSDRFEDWAILNGEEEAAQQIRSGVVSSSGQGEMEFDGLCKWNRGASQAKDQSSERVPGERKDVKGAQREELASLPKSVNPREGRNTSPTQTLSEKLKSPKALDLRTTTQKHILNERNIVQKIETSVNNLIKLKISNKIPEKYFQIYLLQLFALTLGDNEDNVLHILAASGLPLPPQAGKFMNILKMYNISKVAVNKGNSKQETPLLVAVRKGRLEMISLLLDAGANVDATDCDHNTAMHLAVLREEGAMDVIAALLSQQPDITLYNEDGFTVLHLAVSLRKSDIISSLLIKSEEDAYPSDLINQVDRKQGNTALHMAVQQRFKEVVNLLLNFEDQIDVNIKNFAGKTPLAFVIREMDPVAKEIHDRLILSKANPELTEFKEVAKEYKDEIDSESEVVDLEVENVDESLSAYAREWVDTELFDKVTISKLCPLLDKHDDWKTLVRLLNYQDSEVDYCKIHWSPSLLAFKIAALYKPEVTADTVRDHLLTMPHQLRCGAQYIDDMLLQRMGLE